MRRNSLKERLIFWAFCISGAAALVYEVVWTREISLVIGSTSYALSTVLGAFLSGLALGAYLAGKAARQRDPFLFFGFLQIAIAVFGILVPVLVRHGSALYAWLFYSLRETPAVFLFIQFAVVFLLLLIPCTLMGATFPLAIKARTRALETVPEDAGNLYSINTVGSVVGSVISGFLLIPILGMKGAILTAAALNLLAAVMVMGISFRRTAIMMVLFIGIVSVVTALTPARKFPFNLYFASRISSYELYQQALGFFDVVWEKDDIEGVVQVTGGGNPPSYAITIRGKPEGGSRVDDHPNQVLMAYLPLAARPQAESMMKIGLGPGVTLAAAARSKSLSSIDVVEINRSVIEAVRLYFFPDLFKDPPE